MYSMCKKKSEKCLVFWKNIIIIIIINNHVTYISSQNMNYI